MSMPARLCCPTSENAVKAKFTGIDHLAHSPAP
jgi:hypothetical protein